MDENQIIAAIRKAFNTSPGRDRGFYDDAVFINDGKGFSVLKADMFVASTDMPPGMNLRQASRKAVISTLSDLASKGAEALYFVVSMGIPRRINNDRSVQLIIEGLKQASKQYNIRLVGGDVNESRDFVIDVIGFGRATKSAARSGARPGDLVIATGSFGYTGLGLSHLLRGLRLPDELRKDCLTSVYEPSPNFDIARSIVASGIAKASMDSSDGLAMTLHEIAEQSGVAIEIYSLPMDDKIEKLGGGVLDRRILQEAVLYGGEEFHTVITLPKELYQQAEDIASSKNGRLYRIGEVVKGEGVFLTADGGKSWTRIRKRGWVHLT
ncbi:MAG: thiamine-phosphate kinase [Conexivisphaerales archaeon]